jgi:hypothetical protein
MAASARQRRRSNRRNAGRQPPRRNHSTVRAGVRRAPGWEPRRAPAARSAP